MGKQAENDTLMMTKAQAAIVAEVTPAAITAAARDGRLVVAMRTAGGIRLFRRADVEAYAAQRRHRGKRVA